MTFNGKTMAGINNVMCEIENSMASDYVESHYGEMVKTAMKMGVDPNKCHDIVHDVYMSLKHSEENDDGFNPSRGNRCDYITVSEFVYGRLKGYARNPKYQRDNGTGEEVCASGSKCSDEPDHYQMAYENAPSFDEIEALNNEIDMPEEIDFLLTFEGKNGVNMKFILKNVCKLARMSFDISIMDGLRKLISSNKDFAESLMSVVTFAGTNPSQYEAIVAAL